jgi:Tfp pilus assembly protein PilO
MVTALLALLALNVLAFAFVVQPKVRDYRVLDEQSLPRRKALAERNKEVGAREDYLKALTQAEIDLKSLRNDVLSTRSRRMIAVNMMLAELAEQFHIRLERIQYENNVLEDEGLERYAMIVPLEGGYANLRRFIQAIESSGEFLVIERVALDRAQDGGVMLQLNITLATYFDVPDLREKIEERQARRRAGRRA